MDPIATIKPPKDTTLALLLEAQRRGWTLVYMELGDLYLEGGAPWARQRLLAVKDDPTGWFTLEGGSDAPLGELDVILMRKDPPFDMEYIYATYILERAQLAGTLVVNRPESLRDVSEKAYTACCPECCPPTLIARDMARLRRFVHAQGEVVLKPLDGMGGMGVFRVKADGMNLGSIIETLNHDGARSVMAQNFIPEIKAGDKRILLIGGEPVPYSLARIPQGNEVRGNLAAGGRGVAQPLSARDREIGEALAGPLWAEGMLVVGIDVIGAFLTEVNVTSPTCFVEITEQTGFNVAGMFIDALEKAVSR
jgi:glutathione synthase